MGSTKDVLAVILGGGQGTRLFPLTSERSKPAVPLGGKYRLIDIPVSNCLNSDIIKIFVLTQFNSASLNRHIARTYRFSSFSDGFVEILAAEQTPDNANWFQGTADAVRQNLRHFADWHVKYILILSGDHLYRMDYRDFLKRHLETKADVTISVTPVAEANASDFGLLKTDSEGKIIEFAEKPKGELLKSMWVDTTAFGLTKEEAERKPYLASMGIYIFNKEVLDTVLTRDVSQVDFGREIIPAAIKEYNVQAFLFTGYWEDIGTISAFYKANMDMTSLIPKFNFFDAKAPIYTRPRYLPGSKIQGCEVRDSIISEGCIINESVIENSIIGIRCRIGGGTRIERSLIMGADFYQTWEELARDKESGIPWIGIGERTIIRKAIVDKNVRIGSNVRIVNEKGLQKYDGKNYYIRDGIVIIPKGTLIPNGTVI
ncbi:MAG: glucose-1-phosphate adenylyltransferase [Acidobacteriota bacterium]|nr:glucose-1-phosphate adenylyltransferase [Blastocatellia bacterium]MDW8411659.1 glucose-1-phosphate adenylyltransferase [Acidobacteriota bacterium]